MLIHDAEDDAPPSQRRSVAISQSLHKNPKFKSLFDQLGFGIQARIVATKALMKISVEYGPQCYANEVAATRAFLESTNSITFTYEDTKVPYSLIEKAVATNFPKSEAPKFMRITLPGGRLVYYYYGVRGRPIPCGKAPP